MEEQDKQAKKSGEKAAARRRCKGERERLDRKREAKLIIKKAQRLKVEKLERVKVTKEPSFKQRGCPDPRTNDQVQRDVSAKQMCCTEPSSPDQLDKDVCSKRKTDQSERAGGVLRDGAPDSGSNELVSTLTTCVNLHNKMSRCLFRTRSLTRPLLIRTRLKKTFHLRAGLGSSWPETSPPRTGMSPPNAGLVGRRSMEVWMSGDLEF